MGCPECPWWKYASVSGDPSAINLKGEKFNILALGTFPLLSIRPKSSSRSSEESLLALHGTVMRADRCSHTYVRNLTLKGKWINEGMAFNHIEVKAVQGVAAPKQLQV